MPLEMLDRRDRQGKVTCILCLTVPVTAITLTQGAVLPNLKSAGISPGMLCPVEQHFMGCLQSGTKAASLR